MSRNTGILLAEKVVIGKGIMRNAMTVLVRLTPEARRTLVRRQEVYDPTQGL